MSTGNIVLQANSASDFITAVNAALAALTDPTIISAEFAAQNPQRRPGIEHACVISYTTGGATLGTPFLLSAIEAATIADLATALAAFQTAQSAGFVAGSRFGFLDTGVKEAKYIAWTLYNTTAGANANYVPG